MISSLLTSVMVGQFVPPAKKEKEPRALGLIEISPKKKPRLVPIAILIDGEFYDASAYKAAPVPLALYSDTVYEGLKSGVSQGLFTVKDALHGNDTWIAEGSWRSAEEIQAAAAKKKAASARKATPEDTDARPVLRRAGDAKSGSPGRQGSDTASSDPKAPAAKTGDPKSSESKTDPNASPPASTPPTLSSPSPPPTSPAPPSPTATSASPATPPSAPPAEEQAPEDTNRPALRRGKPQLDPADAKDEVGTPVAAAKKPAKAPVAASSKPPEAPSLPMYSTSVPAGSQIFPAISDAAGPEPRPYVYQMKPEEEQKSLKKMLGLAAIEIQARVKQLASAATGNVAASPHRAATGSASSKTAKSPDFDFKDVQLHVFDLSNSNEPVLIVTASARPRQSAKQDAPANFEHLVTLVAREDIYGELHRVYASVTDTQHLDVSPRVELVDAVDADGDGSGELLFRQVSEAGSAYAIYRVIGNQLWPLFQGTPQ
jgi:hypothetical protein